MELPRESMAERAAEVLRRWVVEGQLLPGTQLREERLVTSLGISRNTLREAFRLLAHDGLLVHRRNYGVFVAELDEAALVDLYQLRRLIECGVVRSLDSLLDVQLDALRGTVAAADFAVTQHDWLSLGTANMRFHEQLVALGGSDRTDELIRRLLAELRLAFDAVPDPQALHQPYLDRNRAILAMLEAGQVKRAAGELERYLRDSEEQLLVAYRETEHPSHQTHSAGERLSSGVSR